MSPIANVRPDINAGYTLSREESGTSRCFAVDENPRLLSAASPASPASLASLGG
jgi:hypothetical protein